MMVRFVIVITHDNAALMPILMLQSNTFIVWLYVYGKVFLKVRIIYNPHLKSTTYGITLIL
jgi:hypothetical protein